MFIRFFIFILYFITAQSTLAINAEEISLNLEPFSANSANDNKIVNNFVIKLNLPEGWYTYYKNGGDAAQGPNLTFENLPQEIESTKLFFTAPNKKTDYGFTNYIYKNDVIFGFNLLKKDETTTLPYENLNIDGKLSFLVCKNICQPITKTFKIEQKVTKGLNPRVEFFALASDFMPTKPTIFTQKDSHLYIKLNNKVKSAMLIPDNDFFINDSAKQEIVKINNETYLKVEVDIHAQIYRTEFSGIIKSNIGNINIKAKRTNIDIQTSQEKIYKIAIAALLAFIGGILLNLMPCVLPVIGLKVFTLLKHKSTKERLKGALSYSAGVFICMIIIVALLLSLKSLGNEIAWGFQLQNHYFVMFMIALLMLIGLNLLGLFEVGGRISNKASNLNMKYSNDFFTGMLTTLVATPCTAPFMAASLGFALTSNSNIIAFTIFSLLALGICFPILLIAIIPKANKLLPKSGDWSERLKQFLAFPIFATVIWLVWVLDSNNHIVTMCLSGVFVASFIGWNLTLSSKIKYLNIILITTLSIFTIYKHLEQAETALQFNKDEIIRLNKQGKNVFVDFTAKWCLTCQYNKKSILDLTEIRTLLHKHNTEFMLADWTNKDDEITAELEKLGRSGVPVYAIYPADGGRPILLPEILTKNTVKKHLEKLH